MELTLALTLNATMIVLLTHGCNQEVPELEDNLQKLQETIDKLEENLREAQQQLLDADAKNKKLIKDLEGLLQAQITALEHQLREMAKKLEAAEGERDGLKQKVSSCQEEISALQRMIEELEEQIQQHEFEMDEARKISFDEGVESVKQQLQELIEVVTTNTTVITEQQEEIERLKKLQEVEILKEAPAEEKKRLLMHWEYESGGPNSNKFTRTPDSVSEILEMAAMRNEEQASAKFAPVYAPTRITNFFFHINARKMVDMVSGVNYALKRKQPVVKFLTIGVGTACYDTDENCVLVDDCSL